MGVSDLVTAKEIRLDRIEPDPHQPRRTFDQERLEELAASIAQEGVLQPIAVRYDEERDRYVILHGERRWRAAQMAGLTAIPAVVRDVPEERRLLQQLMENVVREDLNAVDRAAALRALKAQMGDASWERVAEAVGIKRSRLFQLLGTEKLPDAVQEDIRAGRLSEKQSRVLQGLAPAAQAALARLIVDEGLGRTRPSGSPERSAMTPNSRLWSRPHLSSGCGRCGRSWSVARRAMRGRPASRPLLRGHLVKPRPRRTTVTTSSPRWRVPGHRPQTRICWTRKRAPWPCPWRSWRRRPSRPVSGALWLRACVPSAS